MNPCVLDLGNVLPSLANSDVAIFGPCHHEDDKESLKLNLNADGIIDYLSKIALFVGSGV